MLRRIPILLLALLAVLVDGFFAMVNFYPTGPAPSVGPRREVLAALDPVQARWFQQNVLDEFNLAHHTALVLRVVDEEHLLAALREAPHGGNSVLLAAMPVALAQDAFQAGLVRGFDTVLSPADLRADLAAVRPEVLASSRTQNRQLFLPRSMVLDLSVYRLSAVRDAMLHWATMRPAIEDALRAVNGRGLPADFALEHSPAQWDSYDLFVAGYYWSHLGANGTPSRARIAHRTGLGLDGMLDIVGGVFRAGGAEATLPHLDAPASVDFFTWETVLRAQGVYAEEMFAADGLDDGAMLEGLRQGNFYLGSVDQMEAFSLHGGAHREAQGALVDNHDLGFFTLPRFASLELDAAGHPARRPPGFTFRDLDVWALPANGPSPHLGYELVQWVLSRDAHLRECEALGMLPLRTDIADESAALFRVEWMNDVFAAGLTQWESSRLVPQPVFDNGLGTSYASVWNRLVGARAVPPEDHDGLLAVLRSMPPPVRPTQPVRRSGSARVRAAIAAAPTPHPATPVRLRPHGDAGAPEPITPPPPAVTPPPSPPPAPPPSPPPPVVAPAPAPVVAPPAHNPVAPRHVPARPEGAPGRRMRP